MKKQLPLKKEILTLLYQKWGEHIESAHNPCEKVIDILLNTIITQNEEIQFLKRLDECQK